MANSSIVSSLCTLLFITITLVTFIEGQRPKINLNLPPLPQKSGNKFKFGLSRNGDGSLNKFSVNWNNPRFGAGANWNSKSGLGGILSGKFGIGNRGIKLGASIGGGGGKGVFGKLGVSIPFR